MTSQPDVRRERRLHPRIAPKGTVVLDMLGQTTRSRLANIGKGGMFVQTRVRAPDRMLARTVEIQLRLDGAHAEWLRASARIVRLQADGLALSFCGEPPAVLVSLLESLAGASYAHDRVLSIVLIDSELERRSAMAAGFRATGCAVIEAATPLDAIHYLGESTFEPDVIAVADTHDSNDAREMRAFVERDHPQARLITIGDEIFQPDGFANWLSSSNANADLPRRILDVLAGPRSPRRP